MWQWFSSNGRGYAEDMTAEATIPQEQRDLLDPAETLIGHLATRRPDGSLQSNPVWFEWDGDVLRVSSTQDRQKTRNIEADPHVAISITDPQNPYRYLEVRG